MGGGVKVNKTYGFIAYKTYNEPLLGYFKAVAPAYVTCVSCNYEAYEADLTHSDLCIPVTKIENLNKCERRTLRTQRSPHAGWPAHGPADTRFKQIHVAYK